jgi:hypothetical protein
MGIVCLQARRERQVSRFRAGGCFDGACHFIDQLYGDFSPSIIASCDDITGSEKIRDGARIVFVPYTFLELATTEGITGDPASEKYMHQSIVS